MADTTMSQDSREIFRDYLKNFGFEDNQINALLPQIQTWSSQSFTPQQISNDLLPTTTQFKERFSANAARVKAGLPALSPSQYLATEESYKQVMSSYGLPTAFAQNNQMIQKFLEADVSPGEVQQRIKNAADVVNSSDPMYKDALSQMYGLTQGDMIAHLLDPEQMAPIVARKAQAAQYGAAALNQGLDITPDQTAMFEQYAGGVGTGVDIQKGMQQVAYMTPELQTLGAISGQNYDQTTAEQEVFGGLASAQRKREQLVNEEQNRFTGRSNVSEKSLSGGTAGNL